MISAVTMNHSFLTNLDDPVSMAILDEDVFWTTAHTTRVHWAPKHRPDDQKRFVLGLEPLAWKTKADVMHLLALRPLHTNVQHPCQTHSVCSDICVSLGVQSFGCLCQPGSVFQDRHNHTCVPASDCEFR